MSEVPPPAGPSVALVFTDVQGSTVLWERLGAAFRGILQTHEDVVRRRARAHAGYVVKREGDAFMLAFGSARDAVSFAVGLQLDLHDAPWPQDLGAAPGVSLHAGTEGGFRGLRIRIGIHLGEPLAECDPDTGRTDYFGSPVNLAARVAAAAHGGQVVVTGAVVSASAEVSDLSWTELGPHVIRGFDEPVPLWQVASAELAARHFGPLRASRPRTTNLTPPATSFVGREAETVQLVDALDRGRKLVTLCGPAGAGKTRMARQVAATRALVHPGGAWFADLELATDSGSLVHRVASALEIDVAGHPAPEAVVRRALHDRGEVLLVLDNAEQVVEPVRALLGAWSAALPLLSILVTSQVPLGLEREVVVAVGPLSVEDGMALFLARARDQGASLGPSDRPAVARLVEALDGLPLAIELAAARARLLTPDQMHGLLSRRFDLLRSPRGPESRRTSLKAALAWSFELLEPAERQAIVALSVFRAATDLQALGTLLGDGVAAADVVSALGLHGWIQVEVCLGEPERYRLLAGVHAYLDEKLEELPAPEIEAIRDRHARTLAVLGDEETIRAVDRKGGLRRLRAYRRAAPDIVQALRWIHGRDDEAAFRCVRALVTIGASETGSKDAPSEVLDGLYPAAQGRIRLAVCAWKTEHDRLAGRLDDAEETAQLGIETAIERNDVAYEGKLSNALGNVRWDQGRYTEARALYDRAVACAGTVGDRWDQAKFLANLADLDRVEGLLDAAAVGMQEALGIHREVGNLRSEGRLLGNYGLLLGLLGRRDAAREAFQKALAIHRELGDVRQEATVEVNLGGLARWAGRTKSATEHLERALALYQDEVFEPRNHCATLRHLALLALAHGQLRAAHHHLDVAQIIADSGRSPEVLAALLVARAEVHVRERDLASARQRLDEAGIILAGLAIDALVLRALCVRVELEIASRAFDAAEDAYREAATLATNLGVLSSSELGEWLDRVASDLEEPTDEVTAGAG